MSKFAITFQLDISSNYHAMYYKYVLYKVRIINKKDISSFSNSVLKSQSLKDKNVNITFSQNVLILCIYSVVIFLDLADRSSL